MSLFHSMTPSFDRTPSSARTMPIFRQSDSFQHTHDADLQNPHTETPGLTPKGASKHLHGPEVLLTPPSSIADVAHRPFLVLPSNDRRCRTSSFPGAHASETLHCPDSRSGQGASKRHLVSVGTALAPGNRIGLAVNLIS